MERMLTSFYSKPLATYLVIALIVLSSFAGPAQAMLLPSADPSVAPAPASPFDRAADVRKIQAVLESREIQQRLVDYGLTPEEAMAKVDGMSDEQVHQFAGNLESLQAGGDALGFVAGLLIIALLVVLLIYLLEGRIEVKKR
jgi:hypothetical protein